MPPAIIGGAIAAVGAVGAAKIGSSASKKASKAATQAADQNTAVVERQNAISNAALAPYAQQGVAASGALNSFLGLTPPQPPQQTMAAPSALAQFQGSGQTYGFEGLDGPQGRAFNINEPGDMFGNVGWSGQPQPWNQMSLSGQSGQPAQPMVNGRDAFRTFLENSDYGFQFGEGANRVNSGYAGAGQVKSGAAMKGIERFRQNLQSGYRGEFTGLLGNQQGVGLSAASAQAGVGQNFANSLTNINNSRADAIGNVALLNGQNNAQLVNSLGQIGAGIFGQQSGGNTPSSFYNPRTTF